MIEIILCTDENYIRPTGILIHSLAKKNPQQAIRFHIVSTGLVESSKDSLRRCGQGLRSVFEFYKIDSSVLENCPIRPKDHVSIVTYFRLLLPTILPADLSKILYLDGDILCLDSIGPLWDTDISNFAAAVAPDMKNNDIRILNRLSLPKSAEYFNAGVMLINLDWWRDHDVQNKALRYIFENPDVCQFHDQDALNVLLGNSICHFPIRYNVQEHFFEPFEKQMIERKYFPEIEEAIQSPVFLHYTGSKKPWHDECVHPLRNLWLYVQSQTEWKRTPLAHKFSGSKRLRYLARKYLSKMHIVSAKRIYGDFSPLENHLIKAF